MLKIIKSFYQSSVKAKSLTHGIPAQPSSGRVLPRILRQEDKIISITKEGVKLFLFADNVTLGI